MREVAIMSLVGAGTLAMRSVFIVGSASLPRSLERTMRHAKPAILAALVGSFLAGGGLTVQGVGALVVAALIGIRGGSMLLMIGGGVAVATLLGL